MIRLFLVDDHPVLRDGLRALFEQDPSLHVVGEAESGEQLLARLPATPCDVVLIDLHMPGLDGLTTTRRLRAEFPDVRILILSMTDYERAIGEVLAAGAAGYVLKNAGHDEIVTAVRAVAGGQRFLCSELGLTMLEKLLAVTPEPAPPTSERPYGARAGNPAAGGRRPDHRPDCRKALHQPAHRGIAPPEHHGKNRHQEHRHPGKGRRQPGLAELKRPLNKGSLAPWQRHWPLKPGSPRLAGLASPEPVGWLYRNREALNEHEALPGKLADDLRSACIRGRTQRYSSGNVAGPLAASI